MSNDRVDTNRPEYSWIPFNTKLARRLYEDGWRHRQPEIVDKLKEMKGNGDGMVVAPWVDRLTQWIDPFSLFGTIRRVSFVNAVPIMKSFKTFFGVDAELPSEEPFTPTLNAQSSFFFTNVGENNQTTIHWDLFERVMSSDRTDNDGELSNLLNRSVNVRNVGHANLSGALYWISPCSFLKTDTIDHFLGKFNYSREFGHSYLDRLRLLREKEARPFPELNNEAWLVSRYLTSPEKSALWQIHGGQAAYAASEFLEGGYTAIGFGLDDLDLSVERSDDDVKSASSAANPELGPMQLGVVATFVNQIGRGDIVVMPTGSGVIRYGVVASDNAHYAKDATDWKNRRGVYWRLTEISVSGLKLPGAAAVLKIEAARDELLARIRSTERGTPPPSIPQGDSPRNPYTIDTMLDEGVFLDESGLTRIMAQLERKQNIILQGPPGTGKTFLAKRLAYALMGERADERIASVQFHQSYSYEDFVGGYRPGVNDDQQLVFESRDGAFLRLCQRAREVPDDRFVMLIDEINRGNLSRVFGELLMLIEADKRSSAHAVELQHRIADEGDPDGKFFVPPNVYIIGTMNLADRSLTGMNVAMRRRFAFAELRPRFDSERFRDEVTKTGMPDEMLERIRTRMDALNETIEDDASLGRQYAVGHSFFCPDSDGPPGGNWEAWYEAVVEFEIRPLLEEYWFDDARKAADEVAKLKGEGTG